MAENIRVPVEHLFLNRVEVVAGRCSACGVYFADNPRGAPILDAAVPSAIRTHVFCTSCGEGIMGHIVTDSARRHYQWDWAIPLRSGIAGSNLEQEIATISAQGNLTEEEGFQAFGRTYDSEGAAIIALLQKIQAGEANGAAAFSAWAAVCATEQLRLGIRIIAEREAFHARIFAERLEQLCGEHAKDSQAGLQFLEYLGDPNVSDGDKLFRLAKSFGDPLDCAKPVCYFAALIKKDLQTREALLLFAEDELSTVNWIWKTYQAR